MSELEALELKCKELLKLWELYPLGWTFDKNGNKVFYKRDNKGNIVKDENSRES